MECSLDRSRNVLLVTADDADDPSEAAALRAEFFGAVVTAPWPGGTGEPLPSDAFRGKTVYVCACSDLSLLLGDGGGGEGSVARALSAAGQVFVVGDPPATTAGAEIGYDYEVIGSGRVPRDVHGVGVMFPRYFEHDPKYFHRITAEHHFQSLTESTKPSMAQRTGVYITDVEERINPEGGGGTRTHFNLLRCSSNFSGPTVGFGPSDDEIVGAVNFEARQLFQNPAKLNHVLAQVYHNSPGTSTTKPTRARIKAHSDKTKDTPRNGLMAFVTFYDGLEEKLRPNPAVPFDWGVRGKSGRIKSSGLTKLVFKLKEDVNASEREPHLDLVPEFEVNLSPESVFFMPLSTNRMYTHEIRPPALDAALLPTRLGYVVRCSSTGAVWQDGKTYIKKQKGDGERELLELEGPTPEGVAALRDLYYTENATSAVVDYDEPPFLFSMNKGDYMRPLPYSSSPDDGRRGSEAESVPGARKDGGTDLLGTPPTDDPIGEDFVTFELPPTAGGSNPFEELIGSVTLEDVAKGRKGAILVRPDGTSGCPIVRTCDKYDNPASPFPPPIERLADQIGRRAVSTPTTPTTPFNNIMVERYTNEYFRMGFHSDMALDLDDGAPIVLYSCYRDPSQPPRTLVVESKETGSRREIPLAHHTAVFWSAEANRRNRHKIVLDVSKGPPAVPNEWLGVTLRASKTFVRIVGGRPESEGGTELALADESEARELYALRSRENREVDFRWPEIGVTVSPQDLLGCKLQNQTKDKE